MVCRPGLPAVVAAAAPPVADGVITVIEVMVLRLPSGMVVVLSKVEVLKLVAWVEVVDGALVVEVDEVDEVLRVVDRVEGTLVVV